MVFPFNRRAGYGSFFNVNEFGVSLLDRPFKTRGFKSDVIPPGVNDSVAEHQRSFSPIGDSSDSDDDVIFVKQIRVVKPLKRCALPSH